MRILMLTPYLPYPPSSGGQIRSYNLIKQLYKKHDITLFCYIREDGEREFVPELEKYCQKVQVFKRRKAWSPVNIILAGLTPYPFLVAIYLSPGLRKAVFEELRREDYDLIHSETFYVMTNVPRTKLPTVLVDQTIEHLVYKHFVGSLKFPFIRWILGIDVAKLKFWERYYWRRANKVVAVSLADKKEMLKLDPGLDVDLVPNGVDFDFFSGGKSASKNKERTILFVSNFKWLQNVEAAELLIKKILPEVKKKVPEAKLLIVGQHAPERIKKLAKEDVLIFSVEEGDVESIRQAYKKSHVFVSPMRGPGGTRLKNLAAMASKLPVVTTSIGAEGIGVKDGKEALIRNGEKEIAEAIIELFENPRKAGELAENAYELAAREYSWGSMAKKLDRVYREAAHG